MNQSTKTIAVGSKNPVKINAALTGFQSVFPDERFVAQGYSAPSGVNDQPMSCTETLTGATNRAEALKELAPDVDFRVGIEGGIEEVDGTFFAGAWIVVDDREGNRARGRSGSFALPPEVKTMIERGIELGHANDRLFKERDTKRRGGAIGSLTGGVITRELLYVHAMVLTLVSFHQPELYFGTGDVSA
ncbi:MAG: inosine/xanthosine triphosphatase [Planctomycetota bacterium]